MLCFCVRVYAYDRNTRFMKGRCDMKNLKKKRMFLLFFIVSILICMTACGKINKFPSTNVESTENINESEIETEDVTETTEVIVSTENEIELEREDEDIENKEEISVDSSNANSESSSQENEKKDEITTEIDNAITYTYTDFTKTMYTIGDVNVRNQPNREGEKVGTLHESQMVEVTGQCNETGWYRINYNDSCAYVSNNYLTEELKVSLPESSWVKDLDVAQTTTQIIVVAVEGTHATVSMHTKDANGIWSEDFSTAGRVGKNGIGKTKEGDGKTPIGVYAFNKAFGVLPNPGISSMPYLQVDETYHWIDDSKSKYYNQCVSTREVEVDWSSSEHIFKIVPQYNYVLSINYNEECTPNAGSAIFLHCTSTSFGTTAGCVAIPEKFMIQVMKKLQEDCIIIIDSKTGVYGY